MTRYLMWYYSAMNKSFLIPKVINYLQQELTNCELAAANAHLAATDDQSIAETQYDTLAIESAYLAEGQSRRIVEFKAALQAFEQLALDKITRGIVTLGSVVQLTQDVKNQHWFFIAPAAAGYRFSIDQQKFTVITPKSPIGIALLGKQIDDEIAVTIGNNKIVDEIINII